MNEKLSNCMHGIDVKGRLSDFFPRNVTITEDIAKMIVGKRIYDGDRHMIGKIQSINYKTNEWAGRIVVNSSIYDTICVEYEKSIEINIKGENK